MFEGVRFFKSMKSNFMFFKEKDKKFTGAKLLSELGDQINKLDLTIRMMRPPSNNKITENDETITAETVLKDVKRGFQEVKFS